MTGFGRAAGGRSEKSRSQIADDRHVHQGQL